MFTEARTAAVQTTNGASAGADANTRLTGLTGLVLLVLIVAQVITVIVQPRTVLTLHNTIGLLLVPVTALKLGSTTWRMVRYYRGADAYRRQGPPRMGLRLLGPVLGALTLALLGSGTVLILGPSATRSGALTIHKASFYLWLAAVVVHTGFHLVKAVRFLAADLTGRSPLHIPGGRLRLIAVLSGLLVGGLLAVLFAGSAASYLNLNSGR